MRLFWRRRTDDAATSAPQPKPRKPEPLAPAAIARATREAEEAQRLEARRQAGQEQIERACKTFGMWWPGDSAALPEERERRSWLGRIFGRW